MFLVIIYQTNISLPQHFWKMFWNPESLYILTVSLEKVPGGPSTPWFIYDTAILIHTKYTFHIFISRYAVPARTVTRKALYKCIYNKIIYIYIYSERWTYTRENICNLFFIYRSLMNDGVWYGLRVLAAAETLGKNSNNKILSDIICIPCLYTCLHASMQSYLYNQNHRDMDSCTQA